MPASLLCPAPSVATFKCVARGNAETTFSGLRAATRIFGTNGIFGTRSGEADRGAGAATAYLLAARQARLTARACALQIDAAAYRDRARFWLIQARQACAVPLP